MRVLVDTSVWADFFNGHPSREADALARLIEGGDDICTCGVIVAEVVQGLRRHREEIVGMFRDLNFLGGGGLDLYVRAAELYRGLRQRGVTVRSTVDCIIVAFAESNGCDVLAKDRDIAAILRSRTTAARALQP